MRSKLSRRRIVAGIGFVPVLPAAIAQAKADSPDAALVALGRQFDEITQALDAGGWVDDQAMARLAAIEATILNTEAVTMEGLCVKARAACWARLGDLDPSSVSTTDQRMALSIIRDLVRRQHPGLEQPGALAKFVEEFK